MTPDPPAPSPLRSARPVAAALALVALFAAVRQGGFWPTDALVVAIAAIVAVAVLLWCARTLLSDRRLLLAVAATLALAAWWLIRATTTGSVDTFLPLGAGLLGLVAAYVSVGSLRARDRQRAGWAIAGLGGFVSLAGLAGLIGRVTPLALVSQHTWRLASTLTYSDAAGALVAAGLLVSMALDHDRAPALPRLLVCLSSAALVATQSRGALIACLCGCAFLPLARLWLQRVALLSGAAVGLAAVESSPSGHPQPLLAVLLAAALALSAFWSPRSPVPQLRRGFVAAVAALLALGVVAAELAHTEVVQRVFSPSNSDRASEWLAALHQFASSPFIGVGPDHLLHVHAADGAYAYFVHNELLQVLADAGLIGLALLAASAIALARTMRRVDALSSCATGALVALAVAGLFDFDWHLPVIGLVAGAAAGLATAVPQAPTARSASTSAGRVSLSEP